jgi:anti-anti-sigma factor
MSAAPFGCAIGRHGERVELALTGELDVDTVTVFERAVDEVLAAPISVLAVDLRKLGFIDCRGVRGIVHLHERVRPRLELVPGPPAVQRVFDLAGASAALPFREPASR